MSLTMLNKKIMFPSPEKADENGILAIGGDLSIDRLLLAYKSGIFPWYSDLQPIIWWSPDPRFVLFPNELHISDTAHKLLKKKTFDITFDRCFEEVITLCRDTPRPGQEGTWITPEMQEAYLDLHHAGYAHSCEAWLDGSLSGGLYGVSIGKAFFGESMFSARPNASRIAFITLVQTLTALEFDIIDSQVYTDYVSGFGAHMIPRNQYLDIIRLSTAKETILGSWKDHPLFNKP
jgi:leucyl/phenylalanyl-tRNA---protein transferase